MKKSILAIAVAATMAAPAAMAAPTVYGNIHLTIVDQDSKQDIDLTSNTSAIGVKGSEDLGNGLKAIYKMEFQVDPTGDVASGDALTNRDQFVGLKGGFGTIKFGAYSSNYKQKGGKVDSLYRTPVEGRGGLMHTQSRLHNGRDINRGRMTNAVQYSSPKMGGIQLVANTTLSNSDEETIGVGLRYETKNILAFIDWIDAQPGTARNNCAAVAAVPVVPANPATAFPGVPAQAAIPACTTETAVKIGGKYKTKAFHIAAQYEDAEDLTAFNYIHVNAGFNIDKNNSIQVTVGTAEHINDTTQDTDSFALAFNHQLSKMTNVYIAYGDKSSDSGDDDALAFGIRKKF